MQYIGDAKSGRLVGADQCVKFHSGGASGNFLGFCFCRSIPEEFVG